MLRLLSSIFLSLFVLVAHAIPAKHVQRVITLDDGTELCVTLCGDETFHYLSSADGRAFLLDSLGHPKEISLTQAKNRLASGVRANNARRMARAVKRKSGWGADQNHIRGTYHGLVVLVNFSDLTMQNSREDFDRQFNESGYSDNNCSGSVSDYFLSQSYGKFVLDFDVVGPVTVSRPYAYYGQNTLSGDDMYAATMVAEAVQQLPSDIDLSRYDWDGDGYVDQVYVVYAGYSESNGADDNTIWPHEFELSSAAQYLGDGPGELTINGYKIDTYACSGELRGTRGNVMEGIGTACHEFSHCLCLPDMYATSGNAFGMNAWDLMDYGSYSGKTGNGETPVGFTSYERMYCGWLDVEELTDPCRVQGMPALCDKPVAYMVRNSSGSFPGEYYLLENRQQSGWDTYVPAHGILVLHVDFNEKAWRDNEVNAIASHQRMTIVPADNSLSKLTMAGDTWPGTSGNTSLTDTSKPAATLYNANADGRKFLGHPITDIAETDGLVSFVFDGGPVLDAPVLEQPTDVTTTGFTISWTPVSDATDYQIELMSRNAHGMLIGSRTYVTASTTYTFASLSSELAYSVRVRARLDGIAGEWSGSMAVDLSSGISPATEAGAHQCAAVYDLLGRRVTHPAKGIYIYNGNKYVKR